MTAGVRDALDWPHRTHSALPGTVLNPTMPGLGAMRFESSRSFQAAGIVEVMKIVCGLSARTGGNAKWATM
jgi:hypothetical protein